MALNLIDLTTRAGAEILNTNQDVPLDSSAIRGIRTLLYRETLQSARSRPLMHRSSIPGVETSL